jgi:ribosome-binding protein aMBF1 (putative translation factor)
VLYLVHVFASLLQAIQDARLELKLSQKDVAQKVNEKPSVIQDYESSKAIPNAQILGKLERVLGVKLRGKINSQAFKAALNDKPNRCRYWKKVGGIKEDISS